MVYALLVARNVWIIYSLYIVIRAPHITLTFRWGCFFFDYSHIFSFMEVFCCCCCIVSLISPAVWFHSNATLMVNEIQCGTYTYIYIYKYTRRSIKYWNGNWTHSFVFVGWCVLCVLCLCLMTTMTTTEMASIDWWKRFVFGVYFHNYYRCHEYRDHHHHHRRHT